MGPMALSRRRRQATRPHAANDVPESEWITSLTAIGGPRSKSTGIRAAKLATAGAVHSGIQNHGLRVGAVNRAGATGRATRSRTSPTQGVKLNIGVRADSSRAPAAVHGTAV